MKQTIFAAQGRGVLDMDIIIEAAHAHKYSPSKGFLQTFLAEPTCPLVILPLGTLLRHS